jgi:hypothetical protein
MKLPREVIGHISSFIPTLPRGRFLSRLNLKPYESSREQILLWSAIFKNEQWLEEVTEKDTAKLVLVGSRLRQVSAQKKIQGCEDYEDCYMTLCLLGGTGKIPNWELFKSSLHEHTYDLDSDKLRFTSRITLNIQNLSESYLSILRKHPERRQTPTVIISQEGIREIISFEKGKPCVQYSFYGGSCIQDLSSSNMQELGGYGWLLKLRDNGVRWTVILMSAFLGVKDLLKDPS